MDEKKATSDLPPKFKFAVHFVNTICIRNAIRLTTMKSNALIERTPKGENGSVLAPDNLMKDDQQHTS